MSSIVRPNTTGAQSASGNEGVWGRMRGRWRAAVEWVGAGTPVVVVGADRNPFSSSPKGPGETLVRISKLAQRGLDQLGVRGVKYELITGQRHAYFDQRTRPPKGSAKPPIPTAGPAADGAALDTDLEVTRAIPLQTQVRRVNFKEKAAEHLADLARKVSAFTAAMLMRDRCGIRDTDNVRLLRIAARAAKEGAKETLWDLFASEYNLTLAQRFKAGWHYWAAYQTSLISNTVGAYLDSFAAELAQGLTSEATLTQIIRHFIANTNDFFIQDMGATRAFAMALEPDGDVEKYRRRKIEAHYGSLEDLCREFSRKMVNDDYTVPIGQRYQDYWIIGAIFRAIEWFVNRFIIRRLMKSTILPTVLKAAVDNGIEATAPHNLPFSLALTRFLNRQMESLGESLEGGPSSDEPSLKLPGTDDLRETIKHLKMVLDLEQLRTQPELKRRFLEIDNGTGMVDEQVHLAIQEAIVQACHKLLDHLSRMARSHELSSTLFQLSCAPFSEQERDPEAVRAEFNEEQLKLERGAERLFRKFIERAVATTIKGPQADDAKKAAKAAEDAFREGKQVADTTFDELQRLCAQMTQKIDRSAQDISPNNSVQTDIALFLQHLQVMANRKELQERIERLSPADRDAVYRKVTPFYERVAGLGEEVLRLLELQYEYPVHAAVVRQLALVIDIIRDTRAQFHSAPRHLRGPLILALEDRRQNVSELLGDKAPIVATLEQYIDSVSRHSKQIAREQQVIDAIHALSPPREGQEMTKDGLLEQLLHYEQGGHPPGFQWRDCLREIDKKLKFLPDDEQNELRELIDDGSDLSGKWERLGALLQRIYATHRANQGRDANLLDGALKEAEIWARAKTEKYALIKDQGHTEMQTVMMSLTQGVSALRSEVFRAKLELPIYVETRSMTTALGSAAGCALSVIGGPVGVGVSMASHPATHGFSGLYDRRLGSWGKLAGVLTLGAGVGALASAVPGGLAIAGTAAGAYTGLTAAQAVQENAQEKVLPRVLETFQSAYALATRSQRLAHAFATRLMKTWIRAKR